MHISTLRRARKANKKKHTKKKKKTHENKHKSNIKQQQKVITIYDLSNLDITKCL